MIGYSGSGGWSPGLIQKKGGTYTLIQESFGQSRLIIRLDISCAFVKNAYYKRRGVNKAGE